MKNTEIIQRIPRVKNLNFVFINIPYNNSLTLIKSDIKSQKKIIKSVFNQPKDEAIFIDLYGYQKLLEYEEYLKKQKGSFASLNLLGKGINRYNTNQYFELNNSSIILKDNNLFQVYALENEDEAIIVGNQLEEGSLSNIQILTKYELEEFCFPYENKQSTIILDYDGNIYSYPEDIFPSKEEIVNRYQDYLINLERLKHSGIPYAFTNYLLNQEFVNNYKNSNEGNIPNGFPYCQELLMIQINEEGNLTLKKLKISIFEQEKFLVKTFDISLPTYSQDYFAYLKNVKRKNMVFK